MAENKEIQPKEDNHKLAMQEVQEIWNVSKMSLNYVFLVSF